MDSAPLPTPKASFVLNDSFSLAPDESWAMSKNLPDALLKYGGAP